jgi:hypothetical protein
VGAGPSSAAAAAASAASPGAARATTESALAGMPFSRGPPATYLTPNRASLKAPAPTATTVAIPPSPVACARSISTVSPSRGAAGGVAGEGERRRGFAAGDLPRRGDCRGGAGIAPR